MGSPEQDISAALEQLEASFARLAENIRAFQGRYQAIGSFVAQQRRVLTLPEGAGRACH